MLDHSQRTDRAWAAMVEPPIDTAALISFASGPEMGAVVTFSGDIRNHNKGRQVEYLEYDAYRPMAVRQLHRIASEAAERWNARVAVHHRAGRLEIGECSVFVAAASAHRADAFDACRHVIDTLKQDVPIWKREVWEGGEAWIEGDQDQPVG